MRGGFFLSAVCMLADTASMQVTRATVENESRNAWPPRDTRHTSNIRRNMKKNIHKFVNIGLAAIIVALGFGSCRTSKNLADNGTKTEKQKKNKNGEATPIDTIYVQDPVIHVDRPPVIEPPVCVYGPPSVFQKKK